MPTPVIAEPESVERPVPLRLAAVPDPEDLGADAATTDLPVPPAGPGTSSAIRPGRRQKAHTRPIPISDDDELFDQDAFDPEPNRSQPATGSHSHRTAGVEQPSPDWQALPLDIELQRTGEPDATEADATEREADGRGRRARRGDKPRMPSWDDILLGVRHKSD
jgi:hypothetical protein